MNEVLLHRGALNEPTVAKRTNACPTSSPARKACVRDKKTRPGRANSHEDHDQMQFLPKDILFAPCEVPVPKPSCLHDVKDEGDKISTPNTNTAEFRMKACEEMSCTVEILQWITCVWMDRWKGRLPIVPCYRHRFTGLAGRGSLHSPFVFSGPRPL